MKKIFFLPLAILALALIVTDSSAQDNPLFRHISPDAISVYHINLPMILSKVSLADMMARIPPGKHGKNSQELMEFMKDPTWTGIDTRGDILITGSNSDFVDSANYITVIFHLTDSSKFRIGIHKETHGLRITRHPDKSFSAYKDKMAMVWNNELAAIVIVSPPMKSVMADAAAMGKTDDAKKEPGTPQKPLSVPNYGALAVPKALAALKGWASSPIADDPEFKAAFSDNSDFQMYTAKSNYFKALSKVVPRNVLGGLQLDSLMMYKHSISTVRFENGKITMQSTTELLPEVAAEMAKFPAPPSNEGLLARLPKDQLLGFLSFRLNLRVIGYLLDRIGLRSKLDSALAKKQLSLDDFFHAFKGDVLIAVLAPAHTDSFQRPKPTFYSIVSVDNIIALNKLAETLKTAKDSTGDDSTGKKATKIGKIKNNYALKDNLIVFSDSKASAEGYFTNADKRGNDALTDAIKENPTLMWVDMQAIVNLLMGPVRSDEGADKKSKMLNGLHVLDKMILKKGGLHDGKITSSFELSVTNKDQNVLKTLFDLIPTQK